MAGIRRLLERQLFRSPCRMRRAEILRQRDRRGESGTEAGGLRHFAVDAAAPDPGTARRVESRQNPV